MQDAIKTRRLKLGELLQFSVAIFRNNFKLIALVGIIIYVPYNIVMAMVPGITASDLERFYQTGRFDLDWRYTAAMLVMSAGVLPLVTAAATAMANSGAQGTGLKAENVLDATLGHWGKIIITALVHSLVVGLTLLLIVPGIYFGITMAFYVSAVVVTGKMGFSALRESMKAVKGRFWHSFLMLLCIWSLSGVLNIALLNLTTMVFGLIVLLMGGEVSVVILVATIIGSVITGILCLPFKIAGAMLFLNLYYTKGEA